MSIRKRIYIGFALLMIIFVVNGIVTITTLKYNKKLSAHITDVADPSLRSMYDLRQSLGQSRMFATNWVFLRFDQDSKTRLIAMQDSSFPALKATLTSLSSSWDEKGMADSLKKLLLGFEEVLSDQKPIMASLQKFEDYDDLIKKLTAEEQLENTVIPKSLVLKDLLDSILEGEQAGRLAEQNELEQASERLQLLIIILSLTIVCIGIFFSVYLSNVIIKPLKKMGSIINGLGKGVIKRMNDKERKDEIGEMIKSINNLSQKFLAMGQFALMVGRREFGAHYEPLSEEDTLGKALVAMRDGLKESEKELLRTHFQLETLFKKIDDVFFSMDIVECKILQMSPACEKVYGYHPTDFFKNAKLLYDLTIEEDRPVVDANAVLLGKGKAIQHESRIRHKDNTIHWIESKITPTLDSNSNLIRIDGIVADVTERKEAEELLRKRNTELMKSNMELDKFVYSVSHDLRAPLLSTLGVLNIAKEDTTDDLMAGHLSLMEGSLRRLDGIIKDILDYSGNSKNEIRKEEINFNELIQSVTKNLKYINGSRNVDIKLDVDGKRPFVCDKERISTVLNNLISNAVWYQNHAINNPLINVKIDMSDTETNIIVKDNGIGISKENQPRIFEMFYRVSQHSVGSGLGLYIVKEIVEKLNGKIEVESEPGKGSSFTVHLPNENNIL